MGNIYAAAQMHEKANKIRSTMATQKLQKQVGQSWIYDKQNHLHVFFANDRYDTEINPNLWHLFFIIED